MKLRLDNSGNRIILNKDQTFRTDSGWDESFQTYERELLEEIFDLDFKFCEIKSKTNIWRNYYKLSTSKQPFSRYEL
mgnify:CR=1 FL=1